MSDLPPPLPDRPAAFAVADPLSDPQLFIGVMLRRIFAYLVDLAVLLGIFILFKFALAILTIATFGLLTPLLLLIGTIIPVAYHTLTIGSTSSATLGMRLLGLEVRVWNGGKPGYLQAFLHTAIFYVTISFTGGLILLFALFNNRRRCLHDFLCGTVVIRRRPTGVGI